MSLSIKENIDILKRVQEIDRQIYSLQRQCEEIPEQRARFKKELGFERNHLKSLEDDFKKIQLKQKEQEGELAQREANVKKFDQQLGQVKTNKEYSALQQEIASLRADNSLLEEEIIRLLDQLEAVEEEIKKEQGRLKQVEKDQEEKDQQLAQKEKEFSATLEDLKKRREETIKQVTPEARGLYDLIVQKKQGVGLVKVNGETCGACQLQLRPQVLNELRMAQNLIVCENCSRILYLEE